MNNFSIKNYIPVLIVVFFLAILVVGFLLIWPKSQESKILNKNIQDKKEEVKQAEAYFKNLKELKNQLASNYPDVLSKISSALPADSSMPSLLKYLQESAMQSGLLLKSVSPSIDDSEKASGLKETKIDLTLEGSYNSFKNFLSVLENSSRLIETDSVSFSSASSKDKPETLSSFNLQIKAFGY